MTTAATVKDIVGYLDTLLDTQGIKDSSCNGLQVQGAPSVRKIGLAVDASLAAYHQAVDNGCQMLIVHHGLIWDGITHITGTTYQHVKFLLDHSLNLYAAHLPLDRHRVVGNNSQLAKILGLTNVKPAFDYHGLTIGCRGVLPRSATVAQIAQRLAAAVGGDPVILPFGKTKNRTVGVVSGGAAAELSQAIELELDCYVTGESAHQNHHQALEAGINVVYAGHYQTETVGVKAVGKTLEKKFRVSAVFLDVPTLV